MSISNEWAEEIKIALKEIGGHGFLNDIYEKIEERNGEKLNSYKDWNAQVRGTIENCSSDSEVFHKNNRKAKYNYFYSVEGKGNGHWGLRGYIPNLDNVDLTEDDCGYPEGKKALRQHVVRERNCEVIKKAKENYKKRNGKLKCEICNFDFESEYGEIGEDFIEGHHLVPVSQMPQGYITKPEEILLVCSNCHRMLHRSKTWLSRETMLTLLKSNNSKS